MVGLFVVNYLVVSLFFPAGSGPVEIPYNLFREQVEAGNVVSVATRADVMQGVFEDPVAVSVPGAGGLFTAAEPEPVEVTAFSTTLPSFLSPGLDDLLLANGVEINAEWLETQRSPLLTLLFSFGPALLMIGLFVWFTRRMARGQVARAEASATCSAWAGAAPSATTSKRTR